MEHRQVGPKGAEHGLSTGGGRPPAKVEHNRNPIQATALDAGHQALLIGGQQISPSMGGTTVATGGTGQGLRIPPQTGLDRRLTVPIKLGPIGAEDLDAVVVGWVVAGGHHQPPRGPDPPDRARHGRGGTEAEIPHLPTGGGQTCGQGGRHHRATGARIPADQHRPPGLKNETAPVAHLQGQGRGDHHSHPTTNPIGAETNAIPEGLTDRMGRLGNHGAAADQRSG